MQIPTLSIHAGVPSVAEHHPAFIILNPMFKYITLVFAFLSGAALSAPAQSLFDEIIVEGEEVKVPTDIEDGLVILPGMTLPTDTTINVADRLYSSVFYMPLVFDSYDIFLHDKAGDPLHEPFPEDGTPTAFFDRLVKTNYRQRYFMQQFMIDNPDLVFYNMQTMPRPPKKYVYNIDPQTARLEVTEFDNLPVDQVKTLVPEADKLKPLNWINTFDGSLQFSQAYISPNWYQGGKSNLNMIVDARYNVKLNPKVYSKVIFETNVSYKLGVNNAPDDTVHKYNISEDLFQINSKFGYKAASRWYYSINLMFKTQLLNNYRPNSDQLQAAFLSPGELNLGIGMTYAYQNKRNTVAFNASLAPFSYNIKMCTNPHLNPKNFGIDEGHTSKSQFGSSVEMTFRWNLTYNITYNSRLFAFTNYDFLQSDWEHTLDFSINRFMSARIYGHLRWDTLAPKREDTTWHKLMFKEVLSIGFSYHFKGV